MLNRKLDSRASMLKIRKKSKKLFLSQQLMIWEATSLCNSWVKAPQLFTLTLTQRTSKEHSKGYLRSKQSPYQYFHTRKIPCQCTASVG